MNVTNQTIVKGDLLWPSGEIKAGELVISGSKIQSIGGAASRSEEPASSTVIQVPVGGVAAPGFIDLQINGAFGHDFTTNPRQIAAVARSLPRYGVTSFLATLISAPLDQYLVAVSAYKELRRDAVMATVLGLHVEGPYLNRTKAGAHPVKLLRRPDIEELLYFDPEVIRLVTLAPELQHALTLIRALRERGIKVGLGHSTATYDEVMAAVDAGARWAAHAFNAMGMLHHRHPGIVGAVLADDRLRVGLVGDPHHVHPAIMRLVAAAKGGRGVTLVSDAMAAAGMPVGTYNLGSQKVEVEAGAVRLANGALAGSLGLLDQAVRNMVTLAKCPLAKTLQMASLTPAEVIGAKSKGKLAPGYDADLVVLDQELQVTLTMIQGKIVFQSGS